MSGDTTTVIIGAGHCGLAMSHCLTALGIDHVVLERGEVANSWRRERWDSLRLLTPNWQATLPGMAYAGDDPDGFMSTTEVVDLVTGYARRSGAPVRANTTVTAVTPTATGYRVSTDGGTWHCRSVVLASGACNLPVVPAIAGALPAGMTSLTAHDYRNPEQLEDGGVLVVGASATGVQLADEIQRSGRPVILSVGEHVRLPRRYRGRDIFWWMDAAGVLDQHYTEADDLTRARNVASPQLVGSTCGATLDLNALQDRGVELVGRLQGLRERTLQFSGGLRNVCTLADLKQSRLLDDIDARAGATATATAGSTPPERFEPTRLPARPALSLDLDHGRIRSIVWATGFRPDYHWLQVPAALDRKGRLRHDGGVVAAPGLYAMGLTFMRRRRSSFICGAGDDATALSRHLKAFLDRGSQTDGRARATC